MLNRIDQFLIDPPAIRLTGVKRYGLEFLWFGIKELRACLFAGLFFVAIFCVPRGGLMGISRYDLLLLIALAIQFTMYFTRLESLDEIKAITLFHLLGFALELFKTSSTIGSWSYPEAGWSKIGGVPLFSGFMYAAVGSYLIQCWRLLDLKIRHHPPILHAVLLSLALYANFFTHHFIGDYRGYIAAVALGMYARSTVIFTPYDRPYKMPLLLAFALIGFFIWLAENMGTFFGVWRYPNQLGAWATVHIGKWGSWSLLVMMTFTITLFLKDIKKRIHVAQ
ncbi:DUF817 domain-containing protein [Scandinavium goeteborgense]|uniref:Uncharacterized membrane protein YoaT (DUF817 family) n=1 Tax=Scandinavium goeteborgense TaxID=1851514 RepID=A0A4R6E7J0_SCAGO|nr:DUF817 domain-containing protein [Scandinavium goeteborgense]TDN53947.1 uncharacterized membrane protein YoaT (DUF817 family) [Scandinavium goeteborgense]